MTCIFIERARGLVRIGASFAARWAAQATHIEFRADNNGVEEAALRETLESELLKTNPDRDHGDERGNAYGDAQRGEGVAQDGLAKVAEGEVGKIARLH